MLRVSSWMQCFQNGSADAILHRLYGEATSVVRERKEAYLYLLKYFAACFGENNEVILCRAPACLQLGSLLDVPTAGAARIVGVSLEVLVAIQCRVDDQVVIYNVNPSYQPRNFLIRQVIRTRKPDTGVKGKEDLRDEDEDVHSLSQWDRFIKATTAYFQELYCDTNGNFASKFCGMNMVVAGNIPQGARLNSSSALIFATAEGLLAANKLSMGQDTFLRHCGQVERTLGECTPMGVLRSIKCSQRGMILRVHASSNEVEYEPFPQDCEIMLCHSGSGGETVEGSIPPSADELLRCLRLCDTVTNARISGEWVIACNQRSATERIIHHLTRTYYAKRNLQADVRLCVPVEGSGVVTEPC